MSNVILKKEGIEDGSMLKYDARTGEWKPVPPWVAFRSVTSQMKHMQEEILILSNELADAKADIERMARIIKEGLEND